MNASDLALSFLFCKIWHIEMWPPFISLFRFLIHTEYPNAIFQFLTTCPAPYNFLETLGSLSVSTQPLSFLTDKKTNLGSSACTIIGRVDPGSTCITGTRAIQVHGNYYYEHYYDYYYCYYVKAEPSKTRSIYTPGFHSRLS